MKSRIWEKKEGKYAKTRQDSGHGNFFLCKICRETFTQTYRDRYGDAMLVPIQMGYNMVAGNERKNLSLSFATKA